MLSAGVDQSRLVIADAPTASESFSFLVMGDTDAGIEAGIEEKGSAFAEGFANQLLRQLGESRFVLHTGDVTYPMGSYENYLNGFLSPYRRLLKQLPSSAAYRATSVVFERPVLPVPGNHDYASVGFGLWQRLLQQLCDRLRESFNIDWGHYGGPGGEAYGQTFLDDLAGLTPEQLSQHLKRHYSAAAGTARVGPAAALAYCLNYQPGQFTRLPNRYYRFRYGGIDFFALDSNTWKTAPDVEGFDHAQLAWLEQGLVESVQDSSVGGRIVYLHHSPYTTETSRWQEPETLWVRRHLRGVLAAVGAKTGARVGRSPQQPIVDLVISGHAHCLEHLKTLETGQGDAQMDWVVCGGSGASLRPQRRDADVEILENITYGQRIFTEKVAASCFFAGRHGKGSKKQNQYSFLKINICPDRTNMISVVPFMVERQNGQWATRMLNALNVGADQGIKKIREVVP